MGVIGTQARWAINSASQGNINLKRGKTFKISDGKTRSAVLAVGEDDPVGIIDKPGAKTIAIDYYEEQGTVECDWRALNDSGEFFSMTRQIINGSRYQFLNCKVSKVDADDDPEGSHMMSVDVIALSVKKL